MRGGRENLRYPADTALAERDTSRPLVSTSKTLQPPVVWRPLATDLLCFTGLSNMHRGCCAFPFALAGLFLFASLTVSRSWKQILLVFEVRDLDLGKTLTLSESWESIFSSNVFTPAQPSQFCPSVGPSVRPSVTRVHPQIGQKRCKL